MYAIDVTFATSVLKLPILHSFVHEADLSTAKCKIQKMVIQTGDAIQNRDKELNLYKSNGIYIKFEYL